MELRQVRYAEAVARHLHFTRAAQELLVAQPALSLQIRHLEEELGATLFDRTSRSVQLTDAGRVFVASARRLLAEADDLHARLHDLSDAVSGRVSVAVQQSVTACGAMPALLAEFRGAYPGVDVVLREENTGQAASLLRTGQIDLALAHLDGSGPGSASGHDDLECEPLYAEDVVLAVAPGHPLRQTARCWRDLAGEPFIGFNESAGLRRTLHRACEDAGFQPRVGYESTALGSIRAIVAAGLGVALLPLPTVLTPGPEVSILPVGPPLQRTIALLTPANRYQSAAARALADLIRRRLTDLVPTPAAPE